jgi:3-oxoadipate enol-lactonase
MPQVHVNNIDLYYQVHGSGQPVVFIHGLGSSTRDWELQVAEFSKTFKVITFDLRGHGQSDKPPGPYSMRLFASDTAGLLQALGIESAYIVGLSLGGGVDSAPELIVRTFKDRWMVWQRFAIVKLLGMRKMGEVLSKRLFPKAEHANLRATFVERWAENDTRAYQEAMRAMIGWSVTDKLGSLRCPTLIVTADQDYTPVAVKEEYTKLIPGARLVVIPDSHHATPVEQPQKFNEAVIEFLKEH